ncbi:MAG: hypothetical protein ACK4NZ_14800 [Tsuneonella sp.]
MNTFKAAAAAIGLSLVIAPVPALAKKKEQLSGLALQQIQAKDFEADKSIAFGAVMTVLQDAGYRIQAADKDTGLITGIGTSKKNLTWMPFVGFGTSKKTPAISAFVEEMGPGLTRIRLNFVMAKIKANAYGSDLGDEEAITESAIYQEAFEKIAQGLFMRQSLAARAAPAAPAAPVAASAVVTPAAPEVAAAPN